MNTHTHTDTHTHIYIYIYTVEKKHDPLLILYVSPLANKWSVYNFNGIGCLNTERQNNNNNNKIEKCFSKKLYIWQGSTNRHLCAEESALRAQYLFCARLTRAWCGGEVRARLKRLPFDVVTKTFCIWKNSILFKKKETEAAVVNVFCLSPALSR